MKVMAFLRWGGLWKGALFKFMTVREDRDTQRRRERERERDEKLHKLGGLFLLSPAASKLPAGQAGRQAGLDLDSHVSL